MPSGIYKRTSKTKQILSEAAKHRKSEPGRGKRSQDFRESARLRAIGNRAHLGKHHSEETKLKMSLERTGKNTREDNPNWKGGYSRTERNKFMQTKPYQKWRKAVFIRDNYTCVHCGIRGTYLEADHIKRYADYPDLRIDINNGRTLCKDCHKKVTFTKGN